MFFLKLVFVRRHTASVARAATATEVLEEWSLESITDAKAEPSIQLSSLYLHVLIYIYII